jgi:DUF917 family protein
LIKPDLSTAEAAVYGGALLGGGGGGWVKDGLEISRLALEVGSPYIVELDELPDEATVVTVSLIGAPAAPERYLKPIHYVRAVELLVDGAGIRVDGLITSENGAAATVNGWFQSAVLGIPVVDAPCNGRAHPTGLMGSIGLTNVKGYVSTQAGAGGNPEAGRYIEILVRGSLERAASLMRQASISAGGLIGVARNPVSASYLRQNGAVGAIGMAIEVGRALLDNKPSGPEAMIEAAVEELGGNVVAEGIVESVRMETAGGFDIGTVVVKAGGRAYELTFWNEYMTMEEEGKRIATFPDLIATMSLDTGLPIITAEISEGQRVALVTVPRSKLILGAGMRDRKLFKQVEEVIKKEIIKYVF